MSPLRCENGKALSSLWCLRDPVNLEANIKAGADGSRLGLVDTLRYATIGRTSERGVLSEERRRLLGNEIVGRSAGNRRKKGRVSKEDDPELGGQIHRALGNGRDVTDDTAIPL